VRQPTLRRLLRSSGSPFQSAAEPRLVHKVLSKRLYGEGVAPQLEAIRAYSRLGALDAALDVYRNATAGALRLARPQTESRQCELEQTQLLNAALAACSRCGMNASSALQLYNEASVHLPAAIDAVSVRTVVHVCASRGRLRSAFGILTSAADRGIANTSGVLRLLKGCQKNLDPTMALQVYGWARGQTFFLQSASQREQSFAMNCLLGALVPARSARPSVQLLDVARESYLRTFGESQRSVPHFRFGSALVVAFLYAGRTKAALELLQEARRRGELLAVPQHDERELISALSNMNNLDETAAAVFDEFEAQRELPQWPDRAMRSIAPNEPWDPASFPSRRCDEAPCISQEEQEEIISKRAVLFGAAANSSPRHRKAVTPRRSPPLLALGLEMPRRGNVSHWRSHQDARRVMDVQAIEAAAVGQP